MNTYELPILYEGMHVHQSFGIPEGFKICFAVILLGNSLCLISIVLFSDRTPDGAIGFSHRALGVSRGAWHTYPLAMRGHSALQELSSFSP